MAAAAAAIPEKNEAVACSVTVAVRSRPFNEREKSMNAKSCLQFISPHSLQITSPGSDRRSHSYTFDFAYDDDVGQDVIFKDMGQKVVDATFEGFNTCIFAYGQTGSGKSYAMMGPSGGRDATKNPGLIPRICTTIFSKIAENEKDVADKIAAMGAKDGPAPLKHVIEVTYLEIYQEKVRCLLNPSRNDLKVRQSPQLGTFVENLTKLAVTTYDEIAKMMEEGNTVRHMAATNMNEQSSRSHAIFSLIVTQERTLETTDDDNISRRTAKVNLVDLAGSERAKSTGAEGDVLKEGANINKSLSTLGLVISALAERSKNEAKGVREKKVHVPYRDSTLTFLLKENLAGNSKTYMISTLSPADVNYEETLSTLRYADRAKAIVTKASVNEDPKMKLIRQLQEETQLLKAKVQEYEEERARRAEAEKARPQNIPMLNLQKVSSPSTSKSKAPAAAQAQQNLSLSDLVTPRTAIEKFEVNEDSVSQSSEEYNTPRDDNELELTKKQLEAAERVISGLQMNDSQRKEQQEEAIRQRALSLKELETTVKAERQDPYIMNIDSETHNWILEYLVEDVTYLGTEDWTKDGERSIQIVGEGVKEKHVAFIKNDAGSVTLRPREGAATYVDGNMVTRDTTLVSGMQVECGETVVKFVDPAVQMSARRGRGQSMKPRAGSPSPSMPAPPLNFTSKSVAKYRDPTTPIDGTMMRTPRPSFRNSSSPPTAPAPAPPPSIDEKETDFRHTIAFVGAPGTGKTSIRSCMVKDLSWFERKKPPLVMTTPGFERQSLPAGTGTKCRLELIDMSGKEEYTHNTMMLPADRITFLLVWRLGIDGDMQYFKRWVEIIVSVAPTNTANVVLVATHKDLCRLRDSEILDVLDETQQEIMNFMTLLQPDEAKRPKVLSRFAVSCFDRSVLCGSSKITKFPDFTAWLGDQGSERCKTDAMYPHALLPKRCLAIAKKVNEMRSKGLWMFPGAEYKALAVSIDPRYNSGSDLNIHTELLNNMGILRHVASNVLLVKSIIVDPDWVFGTLAVLGCCADRQLKSEQLPFSAADVERARGAALLQFGILTVSTATELFRKRLAKVNLAAREIQIIVDLLGKFDAIFSAAKLNPVSFNDGRALGGGEFGDASPGTGDASENKAEAYYLIPAYFSMQVPSAVSIHVTPLLDGPYRKYSLTLLPRGLFGRMVARVARFARSVYVGAVGSLSEPKCTSFWSNCMWVCNSPTSRALVRIVSRSILVSYHDHGDEEFRDGLDATIHKMCKEFPGVRVDTSWLCSCDEWNPIHGNISECAACGDDSTTSHVKQLDVDEMHNNVLQSAFAGDDTVQNLRAALTAISEARSESARGESDPSEAFVKEGNGLDQLVHELSVL